MLEASLFLESDRILVGLVIARGQTSAAVVKLLRGFALGLTAHLHMMAMPGVIGLSVNSYATLFNLIFIFLGVMLVVLEHC